MGATAAVLGSAATASATVGPAETTSPSSVQVQSARSTWVELNNGTATYLYRNHSELSHGVWDDATPPGSIKDSGKASWGSHSSGMLTGTEGEASYEIPGKGEVKIHWNNPYAGSNSYSCTAPSGYSCSWSGGRGNNAHVVFTLSGPAGNTAAAAGAQPMAVPARSTHVTLQNRTEHEMNRTSSSLSHGTWSHNMLPPDTVYPQADGNWQSESNGFMTGTEGKAVYNIPATGTVEISWNNPYAGSNSYHCVVPSGFKCTRSGGSDNNANVWFTVRKEG